MAEHKRFTLATDSDVYFCDPQSYWQRGSNETTNSLLRQYLPKGTDLSVHSQARLNQVARQLNERSRKTLGAENTRRALQFLYCSDRLNPPPLADVQCSAA
jgi:IS30 family transposase